MDGNWEFPVTSTVDDSFTKGLFARFTARSPNFNAKGSDVSAAVLINSTRT